MLRVISLAAVLLLGVTTGWGQGQQIQWERDPERAVARAQETMLPLVFYVLPSSDNRDSRLESDQRRALADPRVVRMCERFVTARLSQSAHRDIIESLGLPGSFSMAMAFVTPDGKVIDQLAPSGVARAESLLDKMKLVFDAYRRDLFERHIKPVLTHADTPAEQLREALGWIRLFHITVADRTIGEVVQRKGLSREILRQGYEVLANLSTRTSIDQLLTLAAEGNTAAQDALAACTPVGAELMLPHLLADGKVRPYVYDALVKSCNIMSSKSPLWWERAQPQLVTNEVERVSALVKEASARWMEEYGE